MRQVLVKGYGRCCRRRLRRGRVCGAMVGVGTGVGVCVGAMVGVGTGVGVFVGAMVGVGVTVGGGPSPADGVGLASSEHPVSSMARSITPAPTKPRAMDFEITTLLGKRLSATVATTVAFRITRLGAESYHMRKILFYLSNQCARTLPSSSGVPFASCSW